MEMQPLAEVKEYAQVEPYRLLFGIVKRYLSWYGFRRKIITPTIIILFEEKKLNILFEE